MNNHKIYYRIYFTLIIILSLIAGATLYVVNSSTDDIVEELTMDQAQTAGRALENHLQELGDRALERAEIIAGGEIFTDAVKTRDHEAMSAILQNLSFDMDYATICDINGITLASKYSDRISGDLSGRDEVSSILRHNKGTVRMEYIPNVGFAVHASTAIYSGNEIVGIVTCGYDLSNPELLAAFTEKSVCEASIFYGDERINTTVTDENGNSIAGRSVDARIIETVLGDKTAYEARVELFGTTYSAYYAPILSEDSQAIGMLFTGVDINATLAWQRNMQYLIIMIAMIAAGVMGIVFFIFTNFSRRFTKTLTELSDKMTSLSTLEKVLDAVDIYIYITDPKTNKILYTNKALMEHLNLRSSVVGEYCWRVFQDGMKGRCGYCSLGKLMNNPSEVVVWEAINTITGRYYRNADRLIDWPGYEKVHFCQRIDITDTRQALEKAKHANRAKSDFLSRISHEMRTPMNAIMGMIKLALKAADPTEVNECLKKASDSSEHLLGIINDVLDISDIESGAIQFSEAELLMQDLIAQSVAVVEHKLIEKRQNFMLYTNEELPVSIIADRNRLSQVIVNLLSNANKFTPEGGNIVLTVSLAESDGEMCKLLFEVEDNGIGISEEQHRRIFNAFEQADNSITRQYDGAGLGLAICSNIVKQMNGEIGVKSKPDKGCIFSFTVRVGVGAYRDNAAQDDCPEADDDIITNIFAGKHILLADDVAVNRDILTALLNETGVTIDCAENGVEVCEMFAASPEAYHLIFMDIHMPEMNGYEATRKIRGMEIPKAKTIPIIAVTADVQGQDIEKCLAFGMNDHVGKPLDMDMIIDKMKHALEIFTTDSCENLNSPPIPPTPAFFSNPLL